ncbi:hypothetical protein SAY87_025591 [Trapa incisa]|uniref:Uncharacterized protein n=1 Tax=Trapa incisa TaxID=236973 RepID=A0AAN7GQS2_9MYRT|nr:hypothetical protein SAY87_025591 [Trapa incisa]
MAHGGQHGLASAVPQATTGQIIWNDHDVADSEVYLPVPWNHGNLYSETKNNQKNCLTNSIHFSKLITVP